MLEIEEARALLCGRVRPITGTEAVPLEESLGRCLAEDIRADYDQPPFDRSPLDGYAVKGTETLSADRDHPVQLKVVGRVYAGEVFTGVLGPREAVRIMTGAPIPAGADTVIRQEDTDLGMGSVSIYAGQPPYKNYCYQGEDYKRGDLLVRRGQRVSAGVLAALASLGKSRVQVLRHPRVAVFATGDELMQPGSPLKPGKIYDSNRSYICGRLAEFGIRPVRTGHIADDAAVMAAEIRALAGQADLVITTGGVSVGEKDIMHEVIDILGAEQLFWKVKIKPGSPTLAFTYQGLPVLALSGNPFGAIANFELLARPMLQVLTGDPRIALRPRQLTLEDELHKGAGMRRFLRGIAEGEGVRLSQGLQVSGAIRAMVDCNCLVEIPAGSEGAVRGARVTVYDL